MRSAGGERPNFAEIRQKVDAKIKEQIEELENRTGKIEIRAAYEEDRLNRVSEETAV